MCDYCGCREVALIGQLTAEHEVIIEGAGEVRRAAERHDRQQLAVAVGELVALLHPHAEREEQGIFAELARLEEFVEHTQQLSREHQQIEAALSAGASGDDQALLAGLTLLRDHIDREEFGLFPAAVISLPADVLDALA